MREQPAPGAPVSGAALISVIVPAKNEEKNLPILLERMFPVPVSYTHLTLPTIYSV